MVRLSFLGNKGSLNTSSVLGNIKEVLLFKMMMVLWLCVIMSEMVYVLDLVCNIPDLQERGREREILKLNNWVYGDLLYSYLFQVFKLVFHDKLLKIIF